MAVLMDDGRSVAFDVKDYADIDHGYAATIHKSQGVTVDRTHVLATPGLDRHATYVALSRHRDSVDLHYGRDDFADEGKLVRTLSRERAKDMASDYTNDFADRRGMVVPERKIDPATEPRARQRGIFDGLRASDLGLKPSAQEPKRLAEQSRPAPVVDRLGDAVARYARARQASMEMMASGAAEPDAQKTVRLAAARMVEQIQPGTARDLENALHAQPSLIGEAAAGRTSAAVRAMQLETELRTNPEVRADRFVQTWQQLRARREKLGGWRHAEERDATDRRLSGMAKAIEKDPALGSALARRAGQLGLGRQWSPEWSARSLDGGMAGDVADRMRARAVGVALGNMLGRERGIGL